jgi:hypothetical protein
MNTDQIHLGGAFAIVVSRYGLSSASEVIIVLATRVRARQPVPGNNDQRIALAPSGRQKPQFIRVDPCKSASNKFFGLGTALLCFMNGPGLEPVRESGGVARMGVAGRSPRCSPST